MPDELRATPEQVARARALLDSIPAGASAPLVTKLKVLARLMEGASLAQIASEVGKTSQRVSQIRTEILSSGVEQTLLGLSAKLDAHARVRGSRRPHAGRPGRETWEAYEDSPATEGEQFVELATLVFTSSLQLAIFVVGRMGGARDREQFARRAGATFHRLVVQLAQNVGEMEDYPAPAWTRTSGFDDISAEIFETLRRQFDDLRRSTFGVDWLEGLQLHTLRERFPADGRAVILWSGDRSIATECISEVMGKSGDRVEVEISRPVDFLPALAGFIYELRNTVTGMGALPNLWVLLNEVNYFEAETPDGFLWETDQREVEVEMRRRFVMRDFFALKGVVMGHNAALASRLRHQEMIVIDTLSVATRVKVVSESRREATAILSIEPLPGFSYEVTCATEVPASSLAKSVREQLRQTTASSLRRLAYSPGPLALLDTMPGQSVVQAWLAGGRSEPSPRHLTLLPRHLIFADSTPGLTDLKWRLNAVSSFGSHEKSSLEKVRYWTPRWCTPLSERRSKETELLTMYKA